MTDPLPRELSFDEAINRLQAAVLHLAKAVNRLIEAVGDLDRRAPKADPGATPLGLLGPPIVDVQKALLEAFRELGVAVDEASGENVREP